MSGAGLDAVLVRFVDLPAVPWRNGGGITREVLRLPAGAPVDGFAARISIADVDASGPFSAYPGIDRIIMLVGGSSMLLTVDGVPTELLPLRPFAFAGDTTTIGEISSPTRDLNVMTDRGRAAATMEVVRGGPVDVPAGVSEERAIDRVIVGLTGGGEVTVAAEAGAAETVFQLGELDCLHLRGRCSAAVRGDAAVITVTAGVSP